MLSSILFLRALLAHADRLQALLGKQWPPCQALLDELLNELLSERNERVLPARVNRIYRSFERTPAEPLVRALFQQAGEQAGKMDPGTRSMNIRDPITLETRSVDLRATGLPPSAQASAEALSAVAHEFVRAVATPGREVYPDVDTDEVHPVCGSIVSFTVTLAAKKAADTTGRVLLPESGPDVEHTLQVHLLFGGRSAWEALIYSAARGTIKAASFSLHAPTIDGERALIEARANFYLNHRWCGEGRRNLDVRRDASVAPLSYIPLPQVPQWRRDLMLQPDALPPDLIVRIQQGTGEREYFWSCLSPHLDLAPPTDPNTARHTLKQNAETFVRELFAPVADRLLSGNLADEVDGAGEAIYRSTPPYFRDCYWAVWRAARDDGFRFDTVQFVTDEPFVPWELMRLADEERAPEVEPAFISIRHCVGRWLASESSRMSQRIAVTNIAVSASDYGNVAAVSKKLPWAARERELLTHDPYHARKVSLTSIALKQLLEGGQVQAVHLACHGKMSISAPNSSLLVLEDTPNDLKPLAVARSEVRRGLGRQHPLVFLNACEVGAAAASLSIVAGFPAAFLNAGAAAVISPLWAINDERAEQIAEEFYRDAFRNGMPLGEILRNVRERWKSERHLTYLAYVLYGDPLARVDYNPPF